ncbi:glycosyltransferase family 2 protein [Candidatus Dojkabacteria bacterium]|nr:glycosyltransferase family 2 protein [Candidatus Dojkabacteria bacterium]
MYNKVAFKNKAKCDFISVIIPVYKDPAGIKDTLESLKTQTLKPSEYEVIVANDGADSETEKVCEEYKVKTVSQFSNKGSYSARDLGLQVSSGEYIAFVNANVKVSKDWLEKGIKNLKKYDYMGGSVVFDKSKVTKLVHWYQYFTEFDNKTYLARRHFCPTVNLFVKRVIIEDLGAFDRRLFSSGDLEFGNRVWMSKKYSQHFDETLMVMHPLRESMDQKMIRVRCGRRTLVSIWDDRFRFLKPRLVLYLARIVLLPYKRIFKEKLGVGLTLQVIAFSYWMRSLELLYIIRIFMFNEQFSIGGQNNG